MKAATLHQGQGWKWVLRTPYNENLNASLRELPGVAFSRKDKGWIFDEDLLTTIAFLTRRHGFTPVEYKRNSINTATVPVTLDCSHPELMPHQKESIKRIASIGNLILSFEMGLGKTVVAIDIVDQLGKTHNLVVCPSSVRFQWADYWERWGQRNTNFPIYIIETKKDWVDFHGEGVVICSYGMLVDAALDIPWDVIVMDESQEIKNPKSLRGRLASKLGGQCSKAVKLCLTGTPATDPKDIFNQIDFLYPGRYGNFWSFVKRYANVWDNGYGLTVAGLNDNNKEEFRFRLDKVLYRVSKSDLPPGSIPPLEVETIHIPNNGVVYHEEVHNGQAHKERLSQATLWAANRKVAYTRDFVNELISNETLPTVVLTYHKDVAKELSNIINDGDCGLITGDVSIQERKEIADSCIERNTPLVCSMKAVGVGIDFLAQFQRVVFAELYWSPIVMTQTIGRFSRLSSLAGTKLWFLTLDGTIDEVIASTLETRVRNLNEITRTTSSEEAIASAFGVSELEEEEFISHLNDIINRSEVSRGSYTL